jgi:hypothetical protein
MSEVMSLSRVYLSSTSGMGWMRHDDGVSQAAEGCARAPHVPRSSCARVRGIVQRHVEQREGARVVCVPAAGRGRRRVRAELIPATKHERGHVAPMQEDAALGRALCSQLPFTRVCRGGQMELWRLGTVVLTRGDHAGCRFLARPHAGRPDRPVGLRA